MKLKGTETEKNLLDAVNAECLAVVKYGLFASAAQKEGYEQIAGIFRKTAENERVHAKIWLDFLDMISDDTEVNLSKAIARENYEWSDFYERCAEIAAVEGFTDIAERFRSIGKTESSHEQRFNELVSDIKLQSVFEKKESVVWECRNCGYPFDGKIAPEVCPACSASQSFFEVKGENYR